VRRPRAGRHIEVRLADFYAPELREPGGEEAKAALSKIALRQQVTCVAGKKSWDRTIAVCRLGSQSIGDLMRAVGVPEGGRGRKR
jgi:micrococcal nuclease